MRLMAEPLVNIGLSCTIPSGGAQSRSIDKGEENGFSTGLKGLDSRFAGAGISKRARKLER